MNHAGRWLLLVAGLALLAVMGVEGAERGTPTEAKAMLVKAVAHYKAVGRKQALEDFTKKVAPFGDRDLYVGCIGPDHVAIANGGFPSLVGSSTDALKDADGRPLGKVMWDAVLKGQESVRYRWMNPVSGKTEPKVSFVAKTGGDICLVGAYNPE
jgi:hypothetical protein